MDDRAWQLIKLLNDKNYTTAAQLAEQIGVSGKTIRNRLKLLSEELEMHGAELESCTGYGYRLHIVDSQKYKAWKAGQTELLWSEHLPESTSERVAFLLELLLQILQELLLMIIKLFSLFYLLFSFQKLFVTS